MNAVGWVPTVSVGADAAFLSDRLQKVRIKQPLT